MGGKYMCEIFCFNSNTPKQVNECLQCFYNHSEEHPDGWGLANMQSDEFVIDKEPVKASCSEHLKNILSNPVIGKNVFAHIRLATVGEIISPNCHPFTEADGNNRSWMLIHNGTIFDYPELDEYKDKETGDTDSERILLYIIDKVDEFERKKGALSTIKERFNLLNQIVRDLSKNNKLNLMIYDGDLTYIHSNIELNKLFGLIDGKIIFESEEHENEYILTEEHQNAIEEFSKSLKRDEINDYSRTG